MKFFLNSFVLLIFLFGCSNPAEEIKKMPKQQQRSILAEAGREVLVEALGEVESRTPVSFLSIKQANVKTIRETVQRATFFSNAVTKIAGYEFEGYVKNSALVAKFKDFKVYIVYIASNGSEISREEFTIYKTVSAGESVRFNVEVIRPDQTTSYKYLILEANRAD